MSGLANDREEIELLDLRTLEEKRIYLFLKRVIDLVGSIVGILIVSPILIFVSLLIKIEDPSGPILFSQTRVGKNGKEFTMYKFRSMVTDAEKRIEDLLKYNEVSGAMFKMKEDPRVTKIGKFIRKTSIDELPQLWNVLIGDMSLVGPRPPLPREVLEYTKYDSQRLIVTPGCTGFWQVNGRNSVGFNEMVELDLEYIRNRSVFVDIKILFKTVKVLFGSKDAF
ncbi:sugar transferase [Bacillus sp. PS06]|nr:sugar transferase [Bacillus sp. PS06]